MAAGDELRALAAAERLPAFTISGQTADRPDRECEGKSEDQFHIRSLRRCSLSPLI
jgi:hypothetical protein